MTNKAYLLVEEVPDICYHCAFCEHDSPKNFCVAEWERIDDSDKKPSWCPIKPLPKQFTTDEILMAKDVKTAIEMRAYNDCLEEILGETE